MTNVATLLPPEHTYALAVLCEAGLLRHRGGAFMAPGSLLRAPTLVSERAVCALRANSFARLRQAGPGRPVFAEPTESGRMHHLRGDAP